MYKTISLIALNNLEMIIELKESAEEKLIYGDGATQTRCGK
jgi:hypothetical protein